MSNIVSSDSVQLAAVVETVPGQTPATPAFMLIRTTGETLQFTPTTQDDAELSGGSGRCQRPAIVTGQTVSGDINLDLHKAPWVDAFLEAVFAGEWGKCPLTGLPGGAIVDTDDLVVGETLKTFTIEKRVPDPASPGNFLYHRYKGCSISILSLNIAPNQAVTATFSVVGGVPELASSMIAGATYASAGSGAKFKAPEVTELSVGSKLAVGTSCFLQATLSFDSQNRGIQCIGTAGDREVVLGNMRAIMSGEVYFANNDILQALLDGSKVGNTTVTLTNADGDKYRFDLFNCAVTNASATANATNTDFTQPLTVEPEGAKVCDDAPDEWYSCAMVSQNDTAPTLP